MGNISGKRLLLIGFIVILLIAIPLTLWYLRQQQTNQSHAVKSTNLTFNPTSSASAPISKNVNDTIPLDVHVDPGANLVSFVKLEIQYDPTVLQAGPNAFVPNSQAFPTVLEGPVYTSGKIDVTLSIGADPTKAIQAPATAGTVTFTALAQTTAGTPTQVTYTATTQILSVGSQDQASENVLSSTQPAFIAIGGTASTTPTVTPTPIPGATATPVPAATATPVPAATATPVPAATATPVILAAATATPVPGTVTPTIAATGSTEVTFGVGAVLTVLTVVGGILFFAL